MFLMFNVTDTAAAAAFYQKALGARILSGDVAPHSEDRLVMTEIDGMRVLLHPGENNGADCTMGCCLAFETTEALRASYTLLIQGAREHHIHDDWEWTPLAAYVTDKYGIKWQLSI